MLRTKTNKKHKKMNKIVASYDSLHYCQCDIGRKHKRKLQRLLGRATHVQQEVRV